MVATKAKTYGNGRRLWGVVGRRMFDSEGHEYELVCWGASRATIDHLVRGEGCDVVEADCSAPLTWHRGPDAQAAWRAVASSSSPTAERASVLSPRCGTADYQNTASIQAR
jgi:hypothetical protein